eukprot:g12316.t1
MRLPPCTAARPPAPFPPFPSGLLPILKPPGVHSAPIGRCVAKALRQHYQLNPTAPPVESSLSSLGKVGHVGTLDPFASGVLPLVFGQATKIQSQLVSCRK